MACKDKATGEKRFCPYCDEEIAEAAFPYCEACKLDVLHCPDCGMSVPIGREKCPSCGVDMREAAKRGV